MNHFEVSELPVIERINTLPERRNERRRAVRSRMHKSICAKSPFSKKQALTRASQLMAEGVSPYLRTYKCHCGYFHLTSQKQHYERK